MSSYPPPPGGPSPWGYGQAQPQDNQAVWALATALISLFASCCCGLFSIGGGIAAIVLARGARTRAQELAGPQADTTMATAAFWVGVGSIAVGVISGLAAAVSIGLDVWLNGWS
ncbi:hypothetical protein H9L21_06205 [Aeromicrobium senzhongii]|uniref:DUF4190 domain-containing protein n=1 Tax=Aeromicrobium senzhongii TaxID=2663859 RepID=A0ABX6SWP7_9ACTN|nr:hypothetical protein [Aeromicrobium senzhongii]MTB87441.1 hypothetical protein [Aeromicrobium senzhongii]QNL95503.1 hypothetical protein H9L21_06205 [Aeromicrobium senzhongii]